jgi:DNA excision repair protein ERCC-5
VVSLLGTASGYDITSPGTVAPDPDLREYHGRMALASIAKRHTPRKLPQRPSRASKPTSTSQPPVRAPLFMDEEADLEAAIQESLEQHDAEVLQRAIESSKHKPPPRECSPRAELPVPESHQQLSASRDDSDSDDDGLFVTGHSRLETALAFANTSPSKRSIPSPPKLKLKPKPKPDNAPSIFGHPSLLMSEHSQEAGATPSALANETLDADDDESEDMDMEVVIPASQGSSLAISKPSGSIGLSLPASSILSDIDEMQVETATTASVPSGVPQIEANSALDATVTSLQQSDDQAFTRVSTTSNEKHVPSYSEQLSKLDSSLGQEEELEGGFRQQESMVSYPESSILTDHRPLALSTPHLIPNFLTTPIPQAAPNPQAVASDPQLQLVPSLQPVPETGRAIEDVSEEGVLSDWGRSPSPEAGASHERETSDHLAQNDSGHWDAAQEMDVIAEEGDFAQFLSQMKGQDLEAARREIDSEIRELNKQKKVAMRDSEDVTQQMISQIMVGVIHVYMGGLRLS